MAGDIILIAIYLAWKYKLDVAYTFKFNVTLLVKKSL